LFTQRLVSKDKYSKDKYKFFRVATRKQDSFLSPAGDGDGAYFLFVVLHLDVVVVVIITGNVFSGESGWPVRENKELAGEGKSTNLWRGPRGWCSRL
jgi:hypothetical protein